MANSKKVVAALSTAAITGLITTALGSTAFAKTSAVLVNNGSNNYKYDLSALNGSYADYSNDSKQGALYQDYAAKIASGKVAAVYDDAQKAYIDFAKLSSDFADAIANGKTFDLNAYTEASKNIVTEDPATILDASVGSDGKVAYAQEPTPATNFAVSSVSPTDNLKTVTINFSKAVDKNTLTTSTVKAYLNGSASTSTYTQGLSADGKSLTLAFSGLNQSDSMKIALTSVKDTDGDTLADYATTVTFVDRTSPVVNSVKVLNNKKFDIYFSEPVNMDTAGVYKTTDATSTGLLTVDGNLTFAKYTAVPTENKVTVELFSELADGSHTLDISKVKDFAGFNIDEKSFTVNTAKDVTAPKATAVTYTSASTVEVTFDEDLSNTANVAASVPGTFELYEAGSIANKVGTVAFKVNSDGTIDNKTVVLTTSSPLTVSSTVGFDVKYKNVADIFGNKTADYTTISGKASDDTTKPTVASYAVGDQNVIKLAFSKKVTTPTAANLVLYEADGTTVVSGIPTITDYDTTSPDGKTFKVTFPGLTTVDSAGYKLKVTGVKDSSIRSNTMDDAVISLVSKDTNPPKLLAAKADEDVTTGNSYDTITLVFSEAMDTTTLNNISNYFVGTTPVNTISGAKVQSVSSDGKKVTLVVPNLFTAAHALPVGTTISMPTLKDVAGNLINNATLSGPASVTTSYTALTSSDVDTVQATSTNTVVVTLKSSSNYTFGNADPQAIDIVNSDGTTSAGLGVIGAQISQDGKTMTITTGKPMNESAKDAVPASLKVKIGTTTIGSTSYNVNDQNGTAVTLNMSIADKIAPSVTSATYKVNGGDDVTLTKSSDGKTFTADLSGKASTDVFSLDNITLGDATAKIQFATPYINTVTGGYYTPAALVSKFNTVTGSGVTLKTLQSLATQDADGDDTTLTITGQVSDDANADTVFGDTNNDNISSITIKIKVK